MMDMSTTEATLNHAAVHADNAARALREIIRQANDGLDRLSRGDSRGWSINDHLMRDLLKAQGALDVLASTVLAGVGDDERDEISQQFVDHVCIGARRSQR